MTSTQAQEVRVSLTREEHDEVRVSLTREEHDEAQRLQRKGATLSEIAKLLDVEREAVVNALYVTVVERRAPRLIETYRPKAPYAGGGRQAADKRCC